MGWFDQINVYKIDSLWLSYNLVVTIHFKFGYFRDQSSTKLISTRNMKENTAQALPDIVNEWSESESTIVVTKTIRHMRYCSDYLLKVYKEYSFAHENNYVSQVDSDSTLRRTAKYHTSPGSRLFISRTPLEERSMIAIYNDQILFY